MSAQVYEAKEQSEFLANKLDEVTPVVLAFNRITASTELLCRRDVAKDLGLKPGYFNEWLKQNKWTYILGSREVAMEDKISRGYMAMKYYDPKTKESFDKNARGLKSNIFITGKGKAKLMKLFSEAEKSASAS